MKTINTATAIQRLALGATLVLALTVSVSAHAAMTVQGAMNQGYAAFRAQNFQNATAWFAYASRGQPNNQAARFWTAYSVGCQQAQARQYAASVASWRRAVAICPASAPTVNVYIDAATDAANGRGTISLRDIVSTIAALKPVVEAGVDVLAWLFAL